MSLGLPHRFDRLLDLAAAIPGAAAAWSAAQLGPLFELRAGVAAPAAGTAVFAIGYGVMRAVTRSPRVKIQPFSIPFDTEMPGELLLETPWPDPAPADDILLLDQPLEASMDALAELLLDDPLPKPEAESRVVRMFTATPKAGELVGRIERHLGRASPAQPAISAPPADATDSLRRALDELRQSLRQA